MVLYDPRRDVAVLAVPGLRSPALTFNPATAPGAPAVIAGYPHDADTAYALTAQEISEDAHAGRTTGRTVSTQGCAGKAPKLPADDGAE